eukprot:c29395_g2_i1 orf=740-1180(+)
MGDRRTRRKGPEMTPQLFKDRITKGTEEGKPTVQGVMEWLEYLHGQLIEQQSMVQILENKLNDALSLTSKQDTIIQKLEGELRDALLTKEEQQDIVVGLKEHTTKMQEELQEMKRTNIQQPQMNGVQELVEKVQEDLSSFKRETTS